MKRKTFNMVILQALNENHNFKRFRSGTTHILVTAVLSILCFLMVSLIPLSARAGAKEDTLVDALGRRVKIPQKVDRIACMYAFTGHVVAMLGRGNDIVAVSNGLKRDVLLRSMYPAILKALVPKFQGAINIEELAGTKPDIVFVSVETGRNNAEAAKLDACRLTWLTIDFHNMAQQQQAIALIGKAIGASKKAADFNAYYGACIGRVQETVASIPMEKRTRVFLSTVEPTRTSAENSLPADWIQAVGVINVAAREKTEMLDGKHLVAIEQILFWNPDVILANEPGVGGVIKKSSKWSSIAAVKNGRVFQMPIGISRWGHPGSLETPLAVLWTAKTIYPDRFHDIDLQGELRWFYKTFFNYNLSDQMVKQILSGQGMRLTKNRKRKM